ncbi:MAG: trans-sulfuration enzyme family protein [Candidatus Promineifilaceae bacterium]
MNSHIETALIRTQTAPSGHREHASSIYMTSSFTFDNAEQARAMFAKEQTGSIYTRYGNPNIDEFVAKMCVLEKAEAGVAVASGMSAMFSALAGLLSSGDHVIAARNVFGTTHKILTQVLPRWGITTTYGMLSETEKWASLVQPNTKLLVVETPSNPTLDLVDLEWLGQFCRQRNIILLVDNVFATPMLQNPIEYGANIVMHSTTKYIDGQGRGVGGVLVGDAKYIDKIYAFTRSTGPAMSPFNAWMFSKSLETLPLRVERHCDNAERLAAWIETQPDIVTVKYPHLPSHPQYELAKRQMRRGGGIVTFEVAGGLEQGRNFLNALQMCSLTANLGDSRTTATHPASTTHAALSDSDRRTVGITPGLIRISAGLEHHEDIIADIAQALTHGGGTTG